MHHHSRQTHGGTEARELDPSRSLGEESSAGLWSPFLNHPTLLEGLQTQPANLLALLAMPPTQAHPVCSISHND